MHTNKVYEKLEIKEEDNFRFRFLLTCLMVVQSCDQVKHQTIIWRHVSRYM